MGIENVMYFALGLLIAGLVALAILPAIWRRAVRLTKKRIEAATPITMAEFRADKDQLRAEFALSTRRLEMNVEALRRRLSDQLRDINRKRTEVGAIKGERESQLQQIRELEEREAELRRRIEDAKRANPAMKIIVADPRRTDTCEIADLHLPVQPGSDVMLFNGMLHLMLWEGWTDTAYIAAHTSGFDELKALVRDCTPEKVAQVCGISQADLLEATRLFAMGGSSDPQRRAATLSLYCMGLNQSSSGTAKNAALINLHLATGQIGKPGAGPFSLTGQPNAMGGREVGGLSNLLPAHRDMANPAHRAEVAAFWGVPEVPAVPGKSALEMFQAVADGEIRALWIACTNPAQSIPDQALVRRALERAEFVVVQEAFSTTATCDFADLLLPATTWGEKEGTVTNSERRISRVRAAVPAAGQARHDWHIATDFARRLATRLERGALLFPYEQPEQVWNEHRESTRGRDLDITGLSYAQLEARPQQWPLPEGQATGKVRLYEDGVFPTADGRARFAATPWKAVAEPVDARYPFSLNTGRLRDQWHGMSRTGTLGRLFGHVPEPVVQMHPQDMARRQLHAGDLVHVTSRRGSLVLPVAASTDLGLSQLFIPMHWGSEFLGGRASAGELIAGVNALTSPVFCPDSKQPELKHAAVKVLKAEMPWQLVAMAWLPAATAQATRQAVRTLLQDQSFVSCVPFGDMGDAGSDGRQPSGLLLRAAAYDTPPPALLDALEQLLGLDSTQTLRYADARRGQRRAVRLERPQGEGAASGDAHVQAVLLSGDTRAEGWIRALVQDRLPAQSFGRQLLSSQAHAPAGVAARGKVVCSCFGVTETAIQARLADCSGSQNQSDDERLAALQGALKCGTNCGSCLPELKRMVRSQPTRAAQAATI